MLADGIANICCGRSYCHPFNLLLALIVKWQMLLPFYVDDGKPYFICLDYWQMLLPWWQMEWPPRVGIVWQML